MAADSPAGRSECLLLEIQVIGSVNSMLLLCSYYGHWIFFDFSMQICIGNLGSYWLTAYDSSNYEDCLFCARGIYHADV